MCPPSKPDFYTLPTHMTMNKDEINELGRQVFEKHCGHPHPWEGVQPWVIALVHEALGAQAAPAKLEDFCGVMQEVREAETARGTKHSIAKWTCPKCRKACSMLELDGEWCHGDGLHISFINGERIVGCTSCWTTA
jgi:hypothetical protein